MDLAPVCDCVKALGHSLPSPHWWMTLTASDQGAWVSGIGAFAAAFAAVWVADRERRNRKRDRHALARVATAYVYMDMQQIAVFGCQLHEQLLKLSNHPEGHAFGGVLFNIKNCAQRIRSMSERASLERINALPEEVGISVCRAVGGVPFACDAVELTAFKLESNSSRLVDERKYLVQNALTLSVPLRGLIPYFEWFGKVFPEDKKESADATIKAITKELAIYEQ